MATNHPLHQPRLEISLQTPILSKREIQSIKTLMHLFGRLGQSNQTGPKISERAELLDRGVGRRVLSDNELS